VRHAASLAGANARLARARAGARTGARVTRTSRSAF
jgi:hypothetical protein